MGQEIIFAKTSAMEVIEGPDHDYDILGAGAKNGCQIKLALFGATTDYHQIRCKLLCSAYLGALITNMTLIFNIRAI